MSGLTFRDTKLAELEHSEVDENFRYLDEKSNLYVVGHIFRGPVQRIHNGQLYLLSSGVDFPFTAVNFATELAAGNWQLLGSGTSYKGELNLTTPVLVNGTGTIGDYYKVVEPGNYDFGAGPLFFNNGDYVLYDGSEYGYYIDNNQLVSSAYLKKTYDRSQIYTGSGANVVIPLNPDGYSVIYLEGTITSVDGFDFSLLEATPATAEYPHEGKPFRIHNRTAAPVTLNHETPHPMFFQFRNAENIVIPVNESVELVNNSYSLMDVYKSFANIEDVIGLPAALEQKANLVDGKVPASELPSYVDDVLEFADLASFPVTGETGKIYVALDTNATYRWSGSAYVLIGKIQGVFLGSATPTDIPTGTGEAFWIATENGTYTNFGGVVVDVNSFAFISRDAGGSFSISQTTVNLDGYTTDAEFLEVSNLLFYSKNFFDKNTMAQSGVWSAINGGLSASNNWISTTKISVLSSTEYTLSGLSNLSSSNARVLFYQENGTFISAIMGTNNANNVTFTTPSNCAKVAFNLFNAVGVGLNPSTSQYTSSLMLQTGAVASTYESFGTKIKKSSLKDTYEVNPNCFYSIDPIGYNGRTSIMIYTKRGNSNKYVGHLVAHELDSTETKYKDLYRLISANEYVYDGVNMSLLSLNTLVNGENECVYLIPSKLDFVGGTHGNEQKQLIEFYADSVKIDITISKSLTACNSCWYIQKSTMHEPPTSGGTVAAGHPIDAIHYKKTVFTSKGYTTYNDMLWQRVVNLQLWYIGIVCVGRKMADFAIDEDFDNATFTSTTNFYLDKIGKKEINYRSQTNNRGCRVTSSIISDTISDNQCGVKVWDRANDAKYYRYTPAYNTVIGNRDKTTTIVEYF